jgi:NAD(P)-dependent dehydrogenase (short-subunit alcohol dehydrogenase family)
MKDKIILITGSTDGIGKQTAIELAKMGGTVLVHGRDEKKGQAVIDEIKGETKNAKLNLFISDFSSLNQVRNLAEEVKAKYDKLDVLINNAGVYLKERLHSVDGFEMTFAVNYLAHFLLTNLLLTAIKKVESARIINVSSMAHSSNIDFEDLQSEKNYSGYSTYALSKLANILFSFKLAEDLIETGVTVNCLHPGVINTKLLREGFGSMGRGVKSGAKVPVYLATSSKLDNVTGKFYSNRYKGFKIQEQAPAQIAYNKEVQDKLWTVSADLVGLNNI